MIDEPGLIGHSLDFSRIQVLGRPTETVQWDLLFVCILSRSRLAYRPANLQWDPRWIGISHNSRRTKVNSNNKLKLSSTHWFVSICRFITTNIRNELDYSPQTIYWLGARFESNKHLKWNDGSNITYKVQSSHRSSSASLYFAWKTLKLAITSINWFRIDYCLGLDSGPTTCRENVKGTSLFGSTVGVKHVNAAIRFVLEIGSLHKIRRLRLQAQQSR